MNMINPDTIKFDAAPYLDEYDDVLRASGTGPGGIRYRAAWTPAGELIACAIVEPLGDYHACDERLIKLHLD